MRIHARVVAKGAALFWSLALLPLPSPDLGNLPSCTCPDVCISAALQVSLSTWISFPYQGLPLVVLNWLDGFSVCTLDSDCCSDAGQFQEASTPSRLVMSKHSTNRLDASWLRSMWQVWLVASSPSKCSPRSHRLTRSPLRTLTSASARSFGIRKLSG